MAWGDQATTALSRGSLAGVDWAEIWKKMVSASRIPTVVGTTLNVSADARGKKDEGKVLAGEWRLDLQSVSATHANYQLQKKNKSYACVLIKCGTAYTFDVMQAQLELSQTNLKIRIDN